MGTEVSLLRRAFGSKPGKDDDEVAKDHGIFF